MDNELDYHILFNNNIDEITIFIHLFNDIIDLELIEITVPFNYTILNILEYVERYYIGYENSITSINIDSGVLFDDQISIEEIMPYLNLCDMYVGNDTFPHHVTSQSQKPSVVIMLNTPKAYTDYSIFHHRVIPDDARLEDIDHNSNYNPNSVSVEKVFKKIIQIKN